MDANSLLNGLLKLFGERIEGVEFVRAYGRLGNRRIFSPTVTGEISGEAINPASTEIALAFKIFLPENESSETAENIFVKMCSAAAEKYSGFSAVSRDGAERDKTTGLLKVECAMTFVEKTAALTACRTVTLGGKEYAVEGVKVSFDTTGKKLVSVGETEPFATAESDSEYTVELTGIETSGLNKLASFTAEIGDEPAIYRRCRWKMISSAADKAVFVSGERTV